jgi:hypothetical protein
MTPAGPRAGASHVGAGKAAEVELSRNAVALSTPVSDQCVRWKCGTAVLWRVTYGSLYDHWPQVWGSSYDVRPALGADAGLIAGRGARHHRDPASPAKGGRRQRQASVNPSRTVM